MAGVGLPGRLRKIESNRDRELGALEIDEDALDSVVGGVIPPPIGGSSSPIKPTTGGGGGGGGVNTGGGIEAPKPGR